MLELYSCLLSLFQLRNCEFSVIIPIYPHAYQQKFMLFIV
jgi:hypothetical protein